MTPAGQYDHDPQARLDYTQDWTPWLTDAADTIVSVTWSASDPGTTLEPVVGSAATGKPRVWVSTTPTTGNVFLTCHIVTAAGRQDDRTDKLVIRQR